MFFFCRFLSPNLGFKFLFVITCNSLLLLLKTGRTLSKKIFISILPVWCPLSRIFSFQKTHPIPLFSRPSSMIEQSFFFQLPFWRGCAHLATSTVPLLVNLNSTTVSKSCKCTLRKKIRQQNRIIGTVVEKPFLQVQSSDKNSNPTSVAEMCARYL